jgi:hypothetical protein
VTLCDEHQLSFAAIVASFIECLLSSDFPERIMNCTTFTNRDNISKQKIDWMTDANDEGKQQRGRFISRSFGIDCNRYLEGFYFPKARQIPRGSVSSSFGCWKSARLMFIMYSTTDVKNYFAKSKDDEVVNPVDRLSPSAIARALHGHEKEKTRQNNGKKSSNESWSTPVDTLS